MFCRPALPAEGAGREAPFLRERVHDGLIGSASRTSGSITRSRHCSERFDAVHEPCVSNCVAAGSRYTSRSGLGVYLASGSSHRRHGGGGGRKGSMTTRRSSLSIAGFISRPRVWEFGAWPQ